MPKILQGNFRFRAVEAHASARLQLIWQHCMHPCVSFASDILALQSGYCHSCLQFSGWIDIHLETSSASKNYGYRFVIRKDLFTHWYFIPVHLLLFLQWPISASKNFGYRLVIENALFIHWYFIPVRGPFCCNDPLHSVNANHNLIFFALVDYFAFVKEPVLTSCTCMFSSQMKLSPARLILLLEKQNKNSNSWRQTLQHVMTLFFYWKLKVWTQGVATLWAVCCDVNEASAALYVV